MNTIATLAQIIFLTPLATFAFLALFHKKLPRHGDWLAVASMGVGLACSLAILGRALFGAGPVFVHWSFDWLPLSTVKTIQMGFLIDGLTAIMLVVVTLVSFLVHLFSVKYMEGDIRYGRYFASLQLFSMSMLGLVLADNVLFLYISWELVGLSSYLLIGHWFEKKSASDAAMKAFITNRIADIGMIIGVITCYLKVGSFQFVDIFAAAGGETNLFTAGGAAFGGVSWQTIAGMGLFIGAMGKSAQWPFHVWLPDAMEGPTPVSALIHAATMVAAGVYLVGRLLPLFPPDVLIFIAYIGAITALFAATIACVQDDIKKVLAYSTLSQLGYMILALGVGGLIFMDSHGQNALGYQAGLFHLTTHAFFKAGLFLGSGAVIYAMHHEQSLSKYGGLKKKLPITFWTYTAFVCSISGVPLLFAGFWSKDAILAAALEYCHDHGHAFLAFSGFFTAFLTAFYMFRQYLLTFFGKPRDSEAHDHAHEAPWQMTVPLIVLAVLAVCAGWGGLKHGEGWFDGLMPPVGRGEIITAYHIIEGDALSPIAAEAYEEIAHGVHEEEATTHAEEGFNAHGWAMSLSIVLATLGILVAFAGYWERADGTTVISPALVVRRIRPLYVLLSRKYYFDELYGLVLVGVTMQAMRLLGAFDKLIVDGLVNLAGLTGKFLGFVGGAFDNWFVDGAVNGLAFATSLIGDKISYSATGRIRNYLLFIALGVIAMSFVLMFAI